MQEIAEGRRRWREKVEEEEKIDDGENSSRKIQWRSESKKTEVTVEFRVPSLLILTPLFFLRWVKCSLPEALVGNKSPLTLISFPEPDDLFETRSRCVL